MIEKILVLLVSINVVPAKHAHSSQHLLKHEGHHHKIVVPYTHKDKHGHVHHYTHVDYFTHPKYKFGYKVKDPHTHDIKEHHEHRDGDKVTGYYSLHQPDGSVRHVHYGADHHSGFHADVKHSTHHIIPKKKHHHHHHEPEPEFAEEDFPNNNELPNYDLFKPPPEHEFQTIDTPILGYQNIKIPNQNIEQQELTIPKHHLHHHDHHHHHHVDVHPQHSKHKEIQNLIHASLPFQSFHHDKHVHYQKHHPTHHHHHHRSARNQPTSTSTSPEHDHTFHFPKHLHLPDFHFNHKRSHKPKIYHKVLSPKYEIYYSW